MERNNSSSREEKTSHNLAIDMIFIGKDFQSIIQSCKIYPVVQ